METNNKKQLLESMSRVYDKAKESHLDATVFEKSDAELSLLSNYFGITKLQAFFTSVIFALNYKGSTVDFSDLIGYFDCNPLKMLEFSDDFNVLIQKNVICRQRSGHHVKLAMSNDQFAINEQVSEAIINGNPMPLLNDEKCLDVVMMLEKINEHYEQVLDDTISVSDFFRRIDRLVNDCEYFPLVTFVKQFDLGREDRVLFFLIIWKALNGRLSIDADSHVKPLFFSASRKVKYLQNLLNGNHPLTQHALVEVEQAVMFNDAALKLTDRVLKQLEEFGLKLLFKRLDNVMLPGQIAEKTLFFSEEEARQLDMLYHLMRNENFMDVQARMKEKKLPVGITVLLHGYPGTGKTETVYQVARRSNRAIFKVEISQSKSMWFGESEKIIKRIFTDYRAFARDCELMPILLFNEADAIIGQRKNVGTSNVAQTENTMQNIILEELENFEGILFATTNLVNNIDRAFDRRFLFKIEFSKPDLKSKCLIWQSKLSQLSEAESEQLAKQFDLSGGQIDNVVRKMEMNQIVSGDVFSISRVEGFCHSELLNRDIAAAIGFKRGAS